jgi:hypothetical protein
MLPLLLGSCSYSIDIFAVAIGGKLAFVSSDSRFECIANIMITAEDGPAAKPDRGDDVLLVRNSTYWWTSSPVTPCSSKFPVFYGQLVDRSKPAVSPKKLKMGIVYQVTTQGGGAYGGGRFRIGRNRQVENLPSPPPQSGMETPADNVE